MREGEPAGQWRGTAAGMPATATAARIPTATATSTTHRRSDAVSTPSPSTSHTLNQYRSDDGCVLSSLQKRQLKV